MLSKRASKSSLARRLSGYLNSYIWPANDMGRVAASRWAALHDGEVLAGVSLGTGPEGVLLALYGGQVAAVFEGPLSMPLSLIPKPKVFTSARRKLTDGTALTQRLTPTERVVNDPDAGLKVTWDGQGADQVLETAPIILSGGRGLGGPEGFQRLAELAFCVAGEVGASRAAVDAGWIDGSRQVGQTGVTVIPNIYIAFGISGAIQHLAGMAQSKHIVAVNTDPSAPIFKYADVGVVGTVEGVVTGMLAALHEGEGN